jgi:hypothetical protein
MAVFGAQPNYLRHQRKPRDLFAFAYSAVCSSSAFRRLGRLSPISSAFFTSNALLEPRPLRSTSITRFPRYYESLYHPKEARPAPRGVPVAIHAFAPSGIPVLPFVSSSGMSSSALRLA